MKNKIAKAILTSIPLFFLASCATTKISSFDPDSISPALIMSINFNEKIDWQPEKNTKKKEPKKNKKVTAKNTENQIGGDDQTIISTKPLIADAERAVYSAFEDLKVGFFDKEVLSKSTVYSNAIDNETLEEKSMQKPADYHLFVPNNEYEAKLTEEISAEYFIYVTFDINKLMTFGKTKRGKATASVTTSVVITNSDGVILKSLTGYEKSKKNIPIRQGIVNATDILPLYPEIIRGSLKNALLGLKPSKKKR